MRMIMRIIKMRMRIIIRAIPFKNTWGGGVERPHLDPLPPMIV